MQFAVLYRRTDHADATSLRIDAADIDLAAKRAVDLCADDEYVVAVWEPTDEPELIAWHVEQQEARPTNGLRRTEAAATDAEP